LGAKLEGTAEALAARNLFNVFSRNKRALRWPVARSWGVKVRSRLDAGEGVPLRHLRMRPGRRKGHGLNV